MKKLLLIVGIVSIIICVIFLLYAALNLFGYYHVLDGSAELYGRLHQRAVIFFAAGIVLAVNSIACFMIRTRI